MVLMRDLRFRAWNPITREMAHSSQWLELDEGLLAFGELHNVKRIWYRSNNRVDDESTTDAEGFKMWGKNAVKCIKWPEIMQFTGLLDKNGKPVFESDIVKGYHISDPKQTMVIKYEDTHWNYTFNMLECIYDFNEAEVIGNVWENPELVKG